MKKSRIAVAVMCGILWIISGIVAMLSPETGEVHLVAFCCLIFGYVTCRYLSFLDTIIKELKEMESHHE